MFALKPNTYHPAPQQGGQTSLTLAFLIGGTSILIAITLAFLAVSFANASFSFQSANRALAVASAGAEDALIRLVRYGGYSPTSRSTDGLQNPGFPPNTYQVAVPRGDDTSLTDTTSVRIEYLYDPTKPELMRITATATVRNSQRKIEVVASVSDATKAVDLISWKLLVI